MLDRLRANVGPGGWSSMKPQLDPASSPIHLDFAPDPWLRKLRFAVGGGVLGLVIAAFWILDLEEGVVTLVVGGFGAMAGVQLLIALSDIGYRKQILFTASTVRVSVSSLLGRHESDRLDVPAIARAQDAGDPGEPPGEIQLRTEGTRTFLRVRSIATRGAGRRAWAVALALLTLLG